MSLRRLALLPRPYFLIALALLYTLLNAPKPLLIDDSAYYYFARQIASDPLRPYDFKIIWYSTNDPAIRILAPPGLLYWWSIAYALFGEQPFLWKLWLLPYSLIFVFALDALFRRFARGVETPLLCMTVLSPTFLPSLNLMLDVPALALSLGAITLFFRACARDSFALALFAGLVAGLGMETKYTAFLAPAVILLYAILFRRVVLGLLSTVMAALLFYSWEVFIATFHKGESHFLVNLSGQNTDWDARFSLWGPMLTIIGGVGPAVALLGLTGMGARWRTVLALILTVGLGYGLLAAVDGTVTLSPMVFPPSREGPEIWPLEYIVFGAFGLLELAVTVVGIFWLFLARDEEAEDVVQLVPLESLAATEGTEPESSNPVPAGPASYPAWQSPFRRVDLFLVLWLLGEIAGYFLLTPFAAVRRVMGVVVVGSLLAGRLASRSCRTPERRGLVWVVASAGMVLGFVFYRVDLCDAFAEKEAAEQSVAFVRARAPQARIWYAGHWGFQYYAEREGMKAILPYDSWFEEGDWLVVPDFLPDWQTNHPQRWGHLHQQNFRLLATRTEMAGTVVIQDELPLRTVMGFYGGQLPLSHHEGPRVRVRIYRVLRPFRPVYTNDDRPGIEIE